MSQLARVEALYRYPVKSMLGDELTAAVLGELGIPGDRTWAVRDESRGDFMTGKRVPALMSCRGRYPDSFEPGSVPEIVLPGGEVLRADAASANRRLGEAIAREVSLWPIGPETDQPDDPEKQLEEFDVEAESREMLARVGDEPIPDFSRLPKAFFEFSGRPSRPFFDALPLLILSRQSLASIARATPQSEIDVRRFRPSLLIDAPDAGDFPEQAWIGQRLQVGEAILSVPMSCSRCAMTVHGFDDLPKDPKIMRKLVSEASGNLGVYAIVERGGTVERGDAIQRLT